MTLSKAQIKSIVNLRLKKFRKKEDKFIVEGDRGVNEGLKSDYIYEWVIATKEYYDNHSKALKGIDKLAIISNADLKKITDTVNPQGIAGVFYKKTQNEKWAEKINSNLIVCLEDVSDPGNVGTIIRNCDWFGVQNLILSNTCADIYNPKTIRSSVGSIFHTNFFKSENLIDDLAKFKKNEYQIIAAALEGKNIFNYKQRKKTILIFGNEANGISDKLLNFSDEKINIPKLGNAESLNVANSSAVILAELTK